MLLDVRERKEWAAGHAPGATHIPLGELPARLGALPQSRPILAICRSGARSEKAAELLVAAGRDARSVEGA